MLFVLDPRGFSYYWHVDSGTITREAPPEVHMPPVSIFLANASCNWLFLVENRQPQFFSSFHPLLLTALEG